MKILVIVITALIILGVGAFITKDNDPETESTTPKNTNQSTSDQDSNSETGTITFDGNSFSPETLTISAGDTVTVKNDSSRTIQFESDPHPAHTSNTELNVDTIRSGQSKSFTTTLTGTFGYHDHLNPGVTGTIIVK